jgi:SAM-dependent methyltransferase
MAEYAFLVLPALNSVYADAAQQLLQGEIAAFNRTVLRGRLLDIREEKIGGVPYVRFSSDHLGASDVQFLSNLSAIYALFEISGTRLTPIELNPLDRFASDLITIQKYQGKTNPLFTKLLMNVTLLSTEFADELLSRQMSVFDPLCGRGTTLNQALMYGYDAAGMEIDLKAFDAYSQFLGGWLKNHRIKHNMQVSEVRQQKKILGHRLFVALALNKELYKSKQFIKIEMINADTRTARTYFKRETFDAIVTDLPYGVRHGSRSSDMDLSRRPLDLLREALPGWKEVLRPGGSIGLSWNIHVAGREKVIDVVADSGLEIVSSEQSFRHTVDQSIVRDLLVGRKRRLMELSVQGTSNVGNVHSHDGVMSRSRGGYQPVPANVDRNERSVPMQAISLS